MTATVTNSNQIAGILRPPKPETRSKPKTLTAEQIVDFELMSNQPPPPYNFPSVSTSPMAVSAQPETQSAQLRQQSSEEVYATHSGKGRNPRKTVRSAPFSIDKESRSKFSLKPATFSSYSSHQSHPDSRAPSIDDRSSDSDEAESELGLEERQHHSLRQDRIHRPMLMDQYLDQLTPSSCDSDSDFSRIKSSCSRRRSPPTSPMSPQVEPAQHRDLQPSHRNVQRKSREGRGVNQGDMNTKNASPKITAPIHTPLSFYSVHNSSLPDTLVTKNHDSHPDALSHSNASPQFDFNSNSASSHRRLGSDFTSIPTSVSFSAFDPSTPRVSAFVMSQKQAYPRSHGDSLNHTSLYLPNVVSPVHASSSLNADVSKPEFGQSQTLTQPMSISSLLTRSHTPTLPLTKGQSRSQSTTHPDSAALNARSYEVGSKVDGNDCRDEDTSDREDEFADLYNTIIDMDELCYPEYSRPKQDDGWGSRPHSDIATDSASSVSARNGEADVQETLMMPESGDSSSKYNSLPILASRSSVVPPTIASRPPPSAETFVHSEIEDRFPLPPPPWASLPPQPPLPAVAAAGKRSKLSRKRKRDGASEAFWSNTYTESNSHHSRNSIDFDELTAPSVPVITYRLECEGRQIVLKEDYMANFLLSKEQLMQSGTKARKIKVGGGLRKNLLQKWSRSKSGRVKHPDRSNAGESLGSGIVKENVDPCDGVEGGEFDMDVDLGSRKKMEKELGARSYDSARTISQASSTKPPTRARGTSLGSVRIIQETGNPHVPGPASVDVDTCNPKVLFPNQDSSTLSHLSHHSQSWHPSPLLDSYDVFLQRQRQPHSDHHQAGQKRTRRRRTRENMLQVKEEKRLALEEKKRIALEMKKAALAEKQRVKMERARLAQERKLKKEQKDFEWKEVEEVERRQREQEYEELMDLRRRFLESRAEGERGGEVETKSIQGQEETMADSQSSIPGGEEAVLEVKPSIAIAPYSYVPFQGLSALSALGVYSADATWELKQFGVDLNTAEP